MVLHIIYLQAAVTPEVAHILIVFRGVLEHWQWEEPPITRYLLLFRPTDPSDNVGERIVILAVHIHWRPSQNTLVSAEGHCKGSTPDTFNQRQNLCAERIWPLKLNPNCIYSPATVARMIKMELFMVKFHLLGLLGKVRLKSRGAPLQRGEADVLFFLHWLRSRSGRVPLSFLPPYSHRFLMIQNNYDLINKQRKKPLLPVTEWGKWWNKLC